jgi:hypothetical protein
MITNFRFIALICISLICPFIVSAQTSEKFYDYSGKFKIWFPATPTESSQVTETDLGEITLYNFIYETEVVTYMVSYCDYPAESIKDSDITGLLNNAKDGFIGALGLTVKEEGTVSIQSYQGIWFDASGDTYYCVMRDYMVNNRLYQIGILKTEQIRETEKQKFLNSFELVLY